MQSVGNVECRKCSVLKMRSVKEQYIKSLYGNGKYISFQSLPPFSDPGKTNYPLRNDKTKKFYSFTSLFFKMAKLSTRKTRLPNSSCWTDTHFHTNSHGERRLWH